MTQQPPKLTSSTPNHLSSLPISTAHRRIAIAVDLSDESSFAVKWAVQNYLRPGDAVILLHVRPTSVLYGVDWGSTATSRAHNIEQDYKHFIDSKAIELASPLVEANVPFKIHVVKDRDMKERLCLEVERLRLSAMIMGSRGYGAKKRGIISKGKLGSVSDYCVKHCVCPVVVVRFPQEDDNGDGGVEKKAVEAELPPLLEDDQEFHDADDELKVIIE
ncbi:unnamed protein product [Withania somnifera]